MHLISLLEKKKITACNKGNATLCASYVLAVLMAWSFIQSLLAGLIKTTDHFGYII